MRKILLAFTALMTLSACTPAQVAWNLMMQDNINKEADPFKKTQMQIDYQFWVDSYNEQRAQATEGHPCADFFDLAIEAGFSPDQWVNPMSRIMNAESGCNPMADNNSSTARGLMQILEMWVDDCGGTYEDLHDPAFNLNCAYHIWQVQGWQAWSTY